MSDNDERIKVFLEKNIPKVKKVLIENKKTNDNFHVQYKEIERIEKKLFMETSRKNSSR